MMEYLDWVVQIVGSAQNPLEILLFLILLWVAASLGYKSVTWGLHSNLRQWLMKKIDVNVTRVGVCTLEVVQDWPVQSPIAADDNNRAWTVKDILMLEIALDVCRRLVIIDGVAVAVLLFTYYVMIPNSTTISEKSIVALFLILASLGLVIFNCAY